MPVALAVARSLSKPALQVYRRESGGVSTRRSSSFGPRLGGMPAWVDLIFESAFQKKGEAELLRLASLLVTGQYCPVATIPLLLEVTTIYHELAGDQRSEYTVYISDMITRPLQRPRVKLSKKVSRSEDATR